MLLAADATLTVSTKDNGVQEVPMDGFFVSYRRTALGPEDVVVSIQDG